MEDTAIPATSREALIKNHKKAFSILQHGCKWKQLTLVPLRWSVVTHPTRLSVTVVTCRVSWSHWVAGRAGRWWSETHSILIHKIKLKKWMSFCSKFQIVFFSHCCTEWHTAYFLCSLLLMEKSALYCMKLEKVSKLRRSLCWNKTPSLLQISANLKIPTDTLWFAFLTVGQLALLPTDLHI